MIRVSLFRPSYVVFVCCLKRPIPLIRPSRELSMECWRSTQVRQILEQLILDYNFLKASEASARVRSPADRPRCAILAA
jgi:hypothetical protein